MTLNGTILRLLPEANAPAVNAGGLGAEIQADGWYPDALSPNYILRAVPRDGRYSFEGDASALAPGMRVSFDAVPGHDYQAGFETASIATDLQII